MSKMNHQHDERGMVSMIVAMIILLVISIIVVAFARVAQREERLALDNQLSTQAYYAAETGVNDATHSLEEYAGQLPGPAPAGGCYNGFNASNALPTTGTAYTLPLDGPTGVMTYSCVTVQPTVDALFYKPLTNTSKVFPLSTQGAATPIQSMSVSWEDALNGHDGAVTDCGPLAAGKFPPDYTGMPNCQVGVLELDIVPANSVKRSVLDAAVYKVFLVPSTAGGLISYTANVAEIKPAACTAATPTPYACNITINLPAGIGLFYVKVRSIYRDSNLSISAYGLPGAVGPALQLVGAQAVIDATGRANDVLHRIQVRVPLTSSNPLPDFAVEGGGGDICKRFSVIPGVDAVPETSVLGNPACQLN